MNRYLVLSTLGTRIFKSEQIMKIYKGTNCKKLRKLSAWNALIFGKEHPYDKEMCTS